MKDWKLMLKAQGLDISDQEVDRMQPSLNALEAAFRPLVAEIPSDIEPALIFRCSREEKE